MSKLLISFGVWTPTRFPQGCSAQQGASRWTYSEVNFQFHFHFAACGSAWTEFMIMDRSHKCGRKGEPGSGSNATPLSAPICSLTFAFSQLGWCLISGHSLPRMSESKVHSFIFNEGINVCVVLYMPHLNRCLCSSSTGFTLFPSKKKGKKTQQSSNKWFCSSPGDCYMLLVSRRLLPWQLPVNIPAWIFQRWQQSATISP